MKAYISYFKIRFKNSLQYRLAAYAGIITQFAWGFMYIMIYESFYKTNIINAPMKLNELSTYIWLQQSFLTLFMTWFLDNELFDLIWKGNVSYELVRPLNLYNIWFSKNCALRLSKALLRFFPILIVASLLNEPYKFQPPQSLYIFILFLFSMFIAFIVVVAYCMLIYIFTFYTVSPVGVRLVFVMIADFFSGGIIPLPFLPDKLLKIIYALPFASMQNAPFRIYIGALSGKDALNSILLQGFWAIILIALGKIVLSHALKRVEIQGG